VPATSSFEQREVIRVPKPWGYELIWGKTDRYVGKVLHVNAGESLSRQYHRKKDETLYLISGRVLLRLSFDGESREVTMQVGDCYHIHPGLVHQIEALEESDIVEVSTPELDDVVRLEDRYGRAGTSEP
jgi:mannose-6-phosphate isomerase-like protein (cupin superfamily)